MRLIRLRTESSSELRRHDNEASVATKCRGALQLMSNSTARNPEPD
jgi:hypothetical protein